MIAVVNNDGIIAGRRFIVQYMIVDVLCNSMEQSTLNTGSDKVKQLKFGKKIVIFLAYVYKITAERGIACAAYSWCVGDSCFLFLILIIRTSSSVMKHVELEFCYLFTTIQGNIYVHCKMPLLQQHMQCRHCYVNVN